METIYQIIINILYLEFNDNFFRVIWAITMVFVAMFHLIFTPFQYLMFSYAFRYKFNDFWRILKSIFNVFLYMNILVNFVTGYYDEPNQNVVLNFKGIFW